MIRLSNRPSSRLTPKTALAASIAMLLVGVTTSKAGDSIFSNAFVGAGDHDADIGLNSTKIYFATGNFSGGALTINGVAFDASATGNPTGPNYTLAGPGNVFTGFSSGVNGQMGALLSDFVYGGNPATFTLNNLTPGQTYVLTTYNSAFGGAGGRITNISSSSGAGTTFDENIGSTGLNLLRYTFTAKTASETVSFSPKSAGDTYHFYGFTTEQVFTNSYVSGANWTFAAWTNGQPDGAGTNAIFPDQGAAKSIALDLPKTVGHIQFNGPNGWTIAGTNTLTMQADVGGASALSAPAGSHTIATPVTLMNDLLKTGAGTVTFTSKLSGIGGLTVGGGTVKLSVANDYTGGTAVQTGATLDLNGTSQSFASLDGGGTIQNNGAGLSAITAGAGTFSGSINDHSAGTGTVGLTKTGSGSLTLAGGSTYSGGTVVNGGTLISTGVNSVGTGPVTVSPNSTWQVSISGQTIAGLSGTGNVTRTNLLTTGTDGSALISSTKNYVQKLDFGNNGGTTVNGVAFDDAASTTGPGYALATATNLFAEPANNTLTGYDKLVSDFYYGDNGNQTPSSLTLSGLTPGKLYDLVLYTQVGIWGSRPQNATFTSGTSTDQLLIDPVNLGFISYKFIAATDTASVSMAAVNVNASFHYFGATVEDVSTASTPVALTVGSAGNFDFGGVISGAAPLVKQGAGTQTLSGQNTYTGPTTINAGTLLVSGSLANSATTVANGGTLRGAGTVGTVTVASGGTVNPGNVVGAAGTMTVGNGVDPGFSLAAGGHLTLELGGATAGQYDRINVASGSGITLAGDLTGSLINGYQATSASDLLFIIINNGSASTTGTFSNAFLLGGQNALTLGGKTFFVSYDANFVSDVSPSNAFHGGNDIALRPVPEPASALSLFGGLGILLGVRRRKS